MFARWLTMLMLVGVCLGCNRAPMTLVPVKGTVTLDGKPVEKAIVLLIPASGLPASGTTKSDGAFQLVTVVGPQEFSGAAPGEYDVAITKFEVAGVAASTDGLSANGVAEPIQKRWIIPERYATPSTSQLKCTVKAGMEPIAFSLTSN